MSKGFITPTALHYVRNHGAVPQLDWDTHRISVGGLVDRPATFSIPELLALLPSYTLPITLVCAGATRGRSRPRLPRTWLPCACPAVTQMNRDSAPSSRYTGNKALLVCWTLGGLHRSIHKEQLNGLGASHSHKQQTHNRLPVT